MPQAPSHLSSRLEAHQASQANVVEKNANFGDVVADVGVMVAIDAMV